MPGKIYPTESKKLLSILTPDELKIIQCDYPFKARRNEKIHELMMKGVSCYVLAELCGLSKSSVHRIGQVGDNTRNLNCNEVALKDDLLQLQEAVNTFYRKFKNILRHRRK